MRVSLLGMVFLSTLLAAVYPRDYSGEEIDEACNCDHCLKTDHHPGQGNATSSSPPVTRPNKEDADGDGSSEICARARDLPDRTFPTVCHMLCHNRCTRYNVTEFIEGDFKRHIATAYRTNYYKLRDGPCKNT